MKKVSFWGSLASIVALAIAITTNAQTTTQNISGNQNTVIGTTNAPVTINYNQESEVAVTKTQLVLNNRDSGVSLVLSKPSISFVTDSSYYVCEALAGTPIELTGNTSSEGFTSFKQVKILAGECQGKIGWASASVIKYK